MRPRSLLLAFVASGLLFAALPAPSALADSPSGASTAPLVAPAPPPLLPPASFAPRPTPPPSIPVDEGRMLRFRAGVSLAGLGFLGIVLGSVLGARAIVDKNAIGTHCNRANQCDLAGYTEASEASDFALTSTVVFPLGLAAAAAGVGLIVSALPVKPGAAAWITPGLGGRLGLATGWRW